MQPYHHCQSKDKYGYTDHKCCEPLTIEQNLTLVCNHSGTAWQLLARAYQQQQLVHLVHCYLNTQSRLRGLVPALAGNVRT